METIIYVSLVRSRNAGGQDFTPVFSIRERKGEYLLLNAGIPREALEAACENKKETDQSGKGAGWKMQIIRLLPERFAEYYDRKLKVRDQQTKILGFDQKTGKLVDGLLAEMKPFLEDNNQCFTVYDETMEKWLGRQEQDFREVWNQLWPYPVLEDFREECFIRELFAGSCLAHYVVLGFDTSLPEMLVQRARHMKSLQFYVNSLSEYHQELLEEFLEDFYEDYGIAAGVQEREERARLICHLPSVILDFSGEAKILTADVAKGSIWLDMDSMEEKRRRLEERNTGITYLSIKKLWKMAGTDSGRLSLYRANKPYDT